MTIFLSDCHLGNKHCNALKLLSFLKNYENEKLIYLVGDIIDDHQLSRWPADHIEALNRLLAFKEVVYLPGNHDKKFKKLLWTKIRNVIITDITFYKIGNKKYLITHGDQYDPWIKYTNFISESWIAKISRFWFEKLHTQFIYKDSKFTKNLIKLAKRNLAIGVICGHSHVAENSYHDGIHYLNCGDWIESCTAIIETNGKFELIYV